MISTTHPYLVRRGLYLLDHWRINHFHAPSLELQARGASVQEVRFLHLFEDACSAQDFYRGVNIINRFATEPTGEQTFGTRHERRLDDVNLARMDRLLDG